LVYVAKIMRGAKGWRAEFPDVRGCSVEARTEAEIVALATRALSDFLRWQVRAGPGLAPHRHYRGPGPAIEVEGALALAIQLREARTDSCLSTRELGERAGVGSHVVEQLEAALTVATLACVLPIAKVLGMRPVIEPERPGEAVGLTKGKRWPGW